MKLAKISSFLLKCIYSYWKNLQFFSLFCCNYFFYPQSRAILFSIIRRGKTAAELSEKHKIPLSSVYKKISDLQELSLIKIDSWEISEKGRKYKVYKSRIKNAEINIKKPEPVLILIPNT